MPARLFMTLALCFPVWVHATPVVVGQLAPAIELPLLSVQGQSSNASLAELRGKVVYLDFWASWCGPCRKSFPLLEKLRQQLGPQGFEVLAVNVDEFEADALQFLTEIPVSYPVVRDGSGSAPQTYGILGMPTAYLIDRGGVVRLVHAGFKTSDAEKLRIEINKLLGE
jgi:thiol-disulfide isomerase/thioredoxin